MSLTAQPEHVAQEVPTHVIPYSENYMGYYPGDMSAGLQCHGYLPSPQYTQYYDDPYMGTAVDYMNVTCYQMVPDDHHGYVDSHVGQMPDYSGGMMYHPMEMTYCPPTGQMYYQTPGSSTVPALSSVKGDPDDDARTFTECSTAATTPNLEHCPNPEVVEDGFDLGYGYDYDRYAVSPSDCYPRQSAGFSGYPGYCVSNFDDVFSACGDQDPLVNDAMVVEIADEIAANVQYLPDKESSGKYSLDKNHPIHCVWRDLNRGHCSWRCRWWENGKRLSKNFNVKRFGEHEAMWMAIAMKIRNSTPVERFQLLKEQREAVRNYCELVRQNVDGSVVDYRVDPKSSIAIAQIGTATRKARSPLNSTKSAQKANWARIAWTYVMVSERRSAASSVVCRLCAKTTKCSRSRNLQQAHIMHLIRMHKNPWKQYLDEEGLTKMCRSALDALYQQRGFTATSEWKLRPGLTPPEPGFDCSSMVDGDSVLD
ncbi:AP2 domain family protein [Babesia bovis T2Bo]|uniref:Uncharacterized protein n=1 Tax=Babesia bovis TaxID=5865 RepID=A7AU88_BABBO|nr:AP2 domain family protein [Babesia bovis T2Bo]EDO06499.1 AP2 domain family protein [Babesia bovis T2Bo]BAN66110.1 hypothetical protein [Babesia bovis]|eukprot:XP_001610067.1 hypothetical protein [Babesia bovis T2Bo]